MSKALFLFFICFGFLNLSHADEFSQAYEKSMRCLTQAKDKSAREYCYKFCNLQALDNIKRTQCVSMRRSTEERNLEKVFDERLSHLYRIKPADSYGAEVKKEAIRRLTSSQQKFYEYAKANCEALFHNAIGTSMENFMIDMCLGNAYSERSEVLSAI